MSLVSILTYVTAILAFLAGLCALLGSPKSDHSRVVWFFGATVSAAIWGISIALFMALTPETEAKWLVPVAAGVYLGGAMLGVTVLGFGAWKYAWGKLLTVVSVVFYAILMTLALQDHSIFFSGHVIGVEGNSLQIVNSWPYWLYVAFLMIDNMVAWAALLIHAKHARQKKVRYSDYAILAGFGISGTISCFFDAILPISNYSLIWVGPVGVGLAILSIYYAMLRYRTIPVDSRWLKVMSSVVLICSGVMAYMMIFYIIFTALFKIPNPSTSILVLNFIMIVIVLLLMPVLNEMSAQVRSMISVGQVDMAYVIKKLNRLASRNIDLRELAGFLADHLHFDYIGFIINGRLYGSKSLSLTSAELSQITHLKQTAHGVWQEPNKTVQKTFDALGLKAAAELRNAKGKTFGQLIVGKPLGKTSFERRDLIQLEMIINLVATVIDSEKHIRA